MLKRRPPTRDAVEERTSADHAPRPEIRRRDPIADLLAFHDDIRDALDALGLCATSTRRGDVDPSAATFVARFFEGPLLWHDEDEEVSVLRRLRGLNLAPAEVALIEATHRGHDRLEVLLEAIVPALKRLARGETTLDIDDFDRDIRALRSLLDGHLRLEEENLFPLAARVFGPAEIEAIAREVTARHGRAMDGQRSRRATPLSQS